MELGLQFSDEDLENNESFSSSVSPETYSPKFETPCWFLQDIHEPNDHVICRRAAFMYVKKEYAKAAGYYEKLIQLSEGNSANLREYFDSCIRCYLHSGNWKRSGELLLEYRKIVVNRQHMFCWLVLAVESCLKTEDSTSLNHLNFQKLHLTPLQLCQWLVQLDDQCPMLWYNLSEIYCRSKIDNMEDKDNPVLSDNRMLTFSDVSVKRELCLLYCSVCWQVVAHGAVGLFKTRAHTHLESVEKLLTIGDMIPESWREIARRTITAPQSKSTDEFIDRGSSTFRPDHDGDSWKEPLSVRDFEHQWFSMFHAQDHQLSISD